jgi:hypothetical protein
MMKMINAMRLTELLPSEKECRHWYEWLKGRGIPTAIIRYSYGMFSVWRQGTVERNRTTSGSTLSDYYRVQCGPEKIDEGYEVVEKCNGFTA